MPGSTIGIGPALRTARERRSKSLEEAARDTKIRPEYLRALEGEDFEALHGDVYVRGFLRSYAQYLGLDAGRVLAAYSRAVGSPAPPPPQAIPDTGRPAEPVLKPRSTASWIVAGSIAVTLFLMAAAFGLLSGSGSVPDPVPLPSAAPSPEPAGRVVVMLQALREVEARIVVDGVTELDGTLQAGEARTFSGHWSIGVEFARGGVVRLKVNREDFGVPGDPAVPYRAVFSPKEEPSKR